MPEHVHLLIGAPATVDSATAIKSLKQRSNARFKIRRGPTLLTALDADHFWQKRFYDFNVYTRKKVIEKLRYMHRNPVARGLVLAPDQWKWSSARFYMYGEIGPVTITPLHALPDLPAELKVKPGSAADPFTHSVQKKD